MSLLISGACVGDCNGDGTVTVDELIAGVGIALGHAGVETCPADDADGNLRVGLDELLTAIGSALRRCPAD